jgi:hypothetical protein
VAALVVAIVFAGIAVLFTRIVWQERFPLQSKRRHAGEVEEPADAVDRPAPQR